MLGLAGRLCVYGYFCRGFWLPLGAGFNGGAKKRRAISSGSAGRVTTGRPGRPRPRFVPLSAMSDPHRFEFDWDRGIREQVYERLTESPELRLEENAGPDDSGLYALFYRGRLAYIGKATKTLTASRRTLRTRLNEHCGKIAQRQNISLEEMRFRYLTFASDWWVVAAEMALIRLLKPEWNTSGFGSKSPGKGRPGTHRVSAWDRQFPPRST